mmetsp:Transcript_8004/g.14478  ORF Transcript_8004/g.14478 Transcript_8004/m.14478 type:complete len:202 (+) Transcript_8004:800-1405(+)
MYCNCVQVGCLATMSRKSSKYSGGMPLLNLFCEFLLTLGDADWDAWGLGTAAGWYWDRAADETLAAVVVDSSLGIATLIVCSSRSLRTQSFLNHNSAASTLLGLIRLIAASIEVRSLVVSRSMMDPVASSQKTIAGAGCGTGSWTMGVGPASPPIDDGGGVVTLDVEISGIGVIGDLVLSRLTMRSEPSQVGGGGLLAGRK